MCAYVCMCVCICVHVRAYVLCNMYMYDLTSYNIMVTRTLLGFGFLLNWVVYSWCDMLINADRFRNLDLSGRIHARNYYNM